MGRMSAYGRIVLNYIKKLVNPGADIETAQPGASARTSISAG